MLVKVLRTGSFAVVCFSYATVTNGILHGLGLYNIPLKNALFALIVHIIACFVFLIPLDLNIFGIVLGMIVFALALSILNQRDINKIVRYKNSSFQRRYILTYFLMILSASIMGIIIYFVNNLLLNNFLTSGTYFSMLVRLLICIFLALFIYCFLIVLLGVVRKRDAQYIPFISKFSLLLRN